MVKDGAPWLAIIGVTLLVNARHLLYSAAIAPYTAERPRQERAFMAQFLTDETFALSLAHFRRIGRFDARGYWLGAAVIFVPWTLGSAIGYLAGGAVDTHRLGLDVAFPAAMAGLSLGMVSGRRDVAAALGAAAVAAPLGLAGGASAGPGAAPCAEAGGLGRRAAGGVGGSRSEGEARRRPQSAGVSRARQRRPSPRP